MPSPSPQNSGRAHSQDRAVVSGPPPSAATIASLPQLVQRLPRLRISVLSEIPDDPALCQQWNALVSEMPCPQVFYTYEWARAVNVAMGDTLRPLLLLAHDDDRNLTGVAALAASGKRVTFLCATTADYCDFIVREENAAALAVAAMQALRQQGFDDIALTNFPSDSPSLAALRRAATSSGLRMHARTAYLCAQVDLATMPLTEAGKVYLPRQKMVRRFWKLMAEGGPAAVIHLRTWAEAEPALPEFYRAHVARFLYTDRISNLVRPERRNFLSALARQLSGAGWLCFSHIHSGTRSISWNYGFNFETSWFWYQPTFVNELEKLSPGFVLLSKLIEEAAANPAFTTVDMGLGAEGYKDRFANASRRTLYVALHRSLLRHWAEIARYRAASTIAKMPAAEKAVRTLIVKGKAVRQRRRNSGLKATGSWALARARRALSWQEEVFFFEAVPAPDRPSDFSLRPITWDLLAEAAIQYCEDDQTLACLLRCASRLRSGSSLGFALTDADGNICHWAWVAPFDGFFLAELQHKLECSDPARVMLFDCWTPLARRGRGYYPETLRRIVASQLAEGKRPWIFSAASNASSRNGIVNAGFQLRYSLISRNTLGLHRVGPGSVVAAPQATRP